MQFDQHHPPIIYVPRYLTYSVIRSMQVTVRAGLEVEGRGKLDSLMRVYQSALRFAYNRLLEGKTDSEVVKLVRSVFGLNSRYAYSALVEAKEVISSQKRLLKVYVRELDEKIKRARRKLDKIKDPVKRKGVKARIVKLERKRREYERRIADGTVPKIVFGGRENFEKLKRGRLTREEWRERRSNQVYCIGGRVVNGSRRVTNGNHNLQLVHIEENKFRLRINVGYKQFVTGVVIVKSPYLPYLLRHLEEKKAYSVRIIRRNGKYEAHITFDVEKEIKPSGRGVAGLDINPTGIAATIVYPDGNFGGSRWFECPGLVHASSNKRDWLVGNLVRDVVLWVKSFGINTVVMEDLKFKNDLDTDRRFNRIASNFVRAKMKRNILTRCLREDIAVILVNPAYTSVIGRLKYAEMFGLNEHQAAAYVIGRRGLGFDEKVPKHLRRLLRSSASPGENSPRIWRRLWRLCRTDGRKRRAVAARNAGRGLLTAGPGCASAGASEAGGPKGLGRRVSSTRHPPPTDPMKGSRDFRNY